MFGRPKRKISIGNSVAIDDIADKAVVLVALFTNADMGRSLWRVALHPYLSVTEAKQLLEKQLKFRKLYGRRLYVNLSGDQFDPRKYDRHVGVDGAAQKVVNHLRDTGVMDIPTPGLPNRYAEQIKEVEQKIPEDFPKALGSLMRLAIRLLIRFDDIRK